MTKTNWTDGDVFTATEANRIEDQLVVICTSGTRPTGVHGQRIYETDTDREYVYVGSLWVICGSDREAFTPSWTNLTASANDWVLQWIGRRTALVTGYTTVSSVSGNVTMDLGSALGAGAAERAFGTAAYYDNSGSDHHVGGCSIYNGSNTLRFIHHDPTSNNGNVGTNAPFTWASTDLFGATIVVTI